MEHKGLWNVNVATLPQFSLNPGIRLKPFQKLAIAFLLACHDKFGFALLGDEMGVGKVSPKLRYC